MSRSVFMRERSASEIGPASALAATASATAALVASAAVLSFSLAD